MGGIEIVPGICVSRETFERLEVYETLLRRWQAKINLISASTVPDIWTRHFADSAQILEILPSADIWVDMGSGAGFPGLVIAIQIRDRSNGIVHLIESDAKKCAFLREVSRETGARTEVHRARIEDIAGELVAQAVTARALAPLSRLVELASPLLRTGATGVFLKGQDIAAELTEIPPYSRKHIEIRPSKSDPAGKIAVVSPLPGGENQ